MQSLPLNTDKKNTKIVSINFLQILRVFKGYSGMQSTHAEEMAESQNDEPARVFLILVP